MTINDALFSSGKDDWETPQGIFDELNAEFNFDIDVAASRNNAKCKVYFDEEYTDTFNQIWSGVCWLNPPYSRPENACNQNCKKKTCCKRGYHLEEYKHGQIDFVRKAYNSVFVDKTADCVVMLIPSRTDTKIWSQYIWDNKNHCPRKGVEIRFIEGRLKFGNADNSAPFPSCIIIYRRKDRTK